MTRPSPSPEGRPPRRLPRRRCLPISGGRRKGPHGAPIAGWVQRGTVMTNIGRWFREEVKYFFWDVAHHVSSLFCERAAKYRRVEHFLRQYSDKYREVTGWEKAVYRGLGGERPMRIWDWAGPKEDRRLIIVAVTPTRVIWWEGNFDDREDSGAVRVTIDQFPLENTSVCERWGTVRQHPEGPPRFCPPFSVVFIDRANPTNPRTFSTRTSHEYVEDMRRAVIALQKRIYRSRLLVPACLAVFAALAAIAAWIAAWR